MACAMSRSAGAVDVHVRVDLLDAREVGERVVRLARRSGAGRAVSTASTASSSASAAACSYEPDLDAALPQLLDRLARERRDR